MTVLHLEREKRLLIELKDDTIRIIKSCNDVEPIKKLVLCHEILDLTLDIKERFKKIEGLPPPCDEDALKSLKKTTLELRVFYWHLLPIPDFSPYYTNKVDDLLALYGLTPRP